MPTYAYVARARTGSKQRGNLTAENRQAALQIVKRSPSAFVTSGIVSKDGLPSAFNARYRPASSEIDAIAWIMVPGP